MKINTQGIEVDLDLLIATYSSILEAYSQAPQPPRLDAVQQRRLADQAKAELPKTIKQHLLETPDPSLVESWRTSITNDCDRLTDTTPASNPFILGAIAVYTIVQRYKSQVDTIVEDCAKTYLGDLIQDCNHIVGTLSEHAANAIAEAQAHPLFPRMTACWASADVRPASRPRRDPKTREVTSPGDLKSVLAGDISKLNRAFLWVSTPQGHSYWEKITSLTEEVLQNLPGSKAVQAEDELPLPGWKTPLTVSMHIALQRVIASGPGFALPANCGFSWVGSPQPSSYWLQYSYGKHSNLTAQHIAYFYHSDLKHCWEHGVLPMPPPPNVIPGIDDNIVCIMRNYNQPAIFDCEANLPIFHCDADLLVRIIEGHSFGVRCGFDLDFYSGERTRPRPSAPINWRNFLGDPLPPYLRWVCLYIFALHVKQSDLEDYPGLSDIKFPAIPPFS